MAAKTISQSELLGRALALMEDDTQIRRAQGKDFMESLAVAIERALADGNAVNIAGIVKLTPKFREGGRREVLKEFGKPEAGKITKNFPAKVSIRATALKRAKEALPSARSKAAQALK